MPLYKTRAIIGNPFDTGESSLIYHALTRDFGRLSISARGAKGSRGGGVAGALQPLAEIEADLFGREGAEIFALRDFTLISAHEVLRGDLERLAAAAFFLDCTLEGIMPGQAFPEVYDLTLRALLAFERCQEAPPLTPSCHFLLRLLSLLGVEPQLDPALLDGSWKREIATSGPPDSISKPQCFVFDIPNGLIYFDAKRHARQPGQTGKAGVSLIDWSDDDRHAISMPSATTLRPEAVRAIYENQRASEENLENLPPIIPAAAVGLLNALMIFALEHLGIRPRSWRFLSQTVLAKVRE